MAGFPYTNTVEAFTRDEIDNAVYALIQIANGRSPVPMTAEEAHIALCALAPHNAKASDYVDTH